VEAGAQPVRVPTGLGGSPHRRGEELGPTLHHAVNPRPQGRGVVPPRGRDARIVGTGCSGGPRPGLGRSHGDRRARRLLRLDPAEGPLPRLVLSGRRRPRAAGAQGRRRPPRRAADRGRDEPRRAAIPPDRADASRDRHAHRARRRDRPRLGRIRGAEGQSPHRASTDGGGDRAEEPPLRTHRPTSAATRPSLPCGLGSSDFGFWSRGWRNSGASNIPGRAGLGSRGKTSGSIATLYAHAASTFAP
jgi:hypothetical protein